jgi:hypothetical protein
MKKTAIILTVGFIILLTVSSCKKDTVTTTITVHDTITGSTLSKAQILANHTWEVKSTYQDLSGTTLYYVRDSINTVGANEDTIRITFTTSGTGTYRDNYGTLWNTTWAFTTGDDENLILQLTGGPSFAWNQLNISDSSILETTPLSDGDLASTRLIPVP